MDYELAMGDYADFGHLGARSPLIQIAEELKKLRDDWQWVAWGSHKIKTDNYSSDDRDKELKRLEALRKSQTKPPRRSPKPKNGSLGELLGHRCGAPAFTNNTKTEFYQTLIALPKGWRRERDSNPRYGFP